MDSRLSWLLDADTGVEGVDSWLPSVTVTGGRAEWLRITFRVTTIRPSPNAVNAAG